MSGSSKVSPQPVSLTVPQAARVLEVAFDDGASFRIPFELMRVYSPSAEVQGHGPGQEVLQTGKREVLISELQPIGLYAVQPRFSETYTFHTVSDDGVRLWVNGQTIIDNWTDHAPTENIGFIPLQAGQLYDIKMEMYESGGGAVAWSRMISSGFRPENGTLPVNAS